MDTDLPYFYRFTPESRSRYVTKHRQSSIFTLSMDMSQNENDLAGVTETDITDEKEREEEYPNGIPITV